MRIGLRLWIGIGISVAIAILMGSAIAWAAAATERANASLSLADRLLSAQSERATARDEFILRGSPSAEAQWQAQTRELASLFEQAEKVFTADDRRALLVEARTASAETEALFGQVEAAVARMPPSGDMTIEYGRLDSIAIGQLFIKAYAMTAAIERLRESYRFDFVAARDFEDFVIALVIVLGTLALVVNSASLLVSVVGRTRSLLAGLRTMGEGRLDHRIRIEGNDEFADIAGAIDEMAARLGASYTSIADLRAEIERREAAERELRKFSAIIEESMNEIFLFDEASLRFLYANRGALANIGYSLGEMLGMTPVDIKPEFTEEGFRAMIRPLSDGRLAQLVFETLHRRKDGTAYPVEIKLQLYRENGAGFFFAIIDDITERRRAEEAQAQALKERESLLRELFHRTRNNMQVIMAILDSEAELSRSDPVREVVRRTNGRIMSMALVHAKLYENEDLSVIDLADYCRELLALLAKAPSCEEGRIEFRCDAESVPAPIETAVPFGLAFHELLSNAIRHAYPGGACGEVRVGLRRKASDGMIELEVADDGVGLPADIEAHYGETLGLQLVRTLVEDQLRGRLERDDTRGLRWVASFPDAQAAGKG